jgi:hypothetical protein
MIGVGEMVAGTVADRKFCPWFGFLTAARLQLYSYGIAVIYTAFLISCYNAGTWILDPRGVPLYTDFASEWIGAVQAAHGGAAALYDPSSFVAVEAALVGARDDLAPNWSYPPTFLLILAPFAALEYGWAFAAWDGVTLLGCLVVVYAIVRQPAAIAVVLASPFTAWNFLAAQNGFLTAALLGAALLWLERWPLLAGVVIGCLTYKPQFGVLFPVALIAARCWRTIASATISAALFAGASAAIFGAGVWGAFPREIAAQAGLNLLADPDSSWGYLQSAYGVVRSARGGAVWAWSAQGLVTLACAAVVWVVWRSRTRGALKAATLSAAALMATPYAFTYDMAAIAIPAAFLARDQIERGLLKGEQTIAIALFGVALGLLLAVGDRPGGVTFGSIPTGPVAVITVLGLVMRRALHDGEQAAIFR